MLSLTHFHLRDVDTNHHTTYENPKYTVLIVIATAHAVYNVILVFMEQNIFIHIVCFSQF